MAKKLTVLVASRSQEAIQRLAGDLAAVRDYDLQTRHINNGHADPLFGLSFVPDVVIMALNEKGYTDLQSLVEEQAAGGPPMIVISEHGDANSMRLAMRAGARDYLCGHVELEDLADTVDRIAAKTDSGSSQKEENLTVFVNAKGGSGATFLASNVAHMLTSASDMSTAVMSLDLQFSSLTQYLDVDLRHGLMAVLESVDTLDDVALDAYMTQHDSGLRLLAAEPQNVIQCHSDKAEQLATLVDKMMCRYDHVVVDMPRRIDPYIVPVLERATKVVLVLQQTLGHLHDAARMLQIFNHYGIASDKICTVINRYDKNSAIGSEDVQRAVKGTEIALVPSDFKMVSESINLGIPMHEHARGSAVTKALLALETKIGGKSVAKRSGLFGGMFNRLRKDKWSAAQTH